MYDPNNTYMMNKGVGPHALGSPLKQTSRVMLDETTVTAKKPKSAPSTETKMKYMEATGQIKKAPGVNKPIKGNPPMVGGASALTSSAVKGFNVMKSAAPTPKVAKALEFIGEAWEAVDMANKFKKKNKNKNKKSK